MRIRGRSAWLVVPGVAGLALVTPAGAGPDLAVPRAPAVARATADGQGRSPAPVESPATVPAALPGPGSWAPDDPALERLHREVDEVLGGRSWRRATWGVLAVSLDSGDTLYARAPDRAMIPASNMKLPTTAAALRYLGPDYRFTTLVLTEAPVVDGVVMGDLVLYGTGDPGLSDRFFPSRRAVFDSLALALRTGGVREIRGSVRGDGTFFEGPKRHPGWDDGDLDEAFAAASDALSYNENVVSLRIEATARGVPPMVHTLPDHGGVPILNWALTGGDPSDRIRVERDGPTEPIQILGSMRPGSRDVWRQMTVQDPSLFAASAFATSLEEAGIRVTTAAGAVTPSESPLSQRRVFAAAGPAPRVLARHRSPPLSSYLEVINRESHNLFADLVLKTLGRVVEGEGSYEAGARVVRAFLVDEVGVPAEQVRVMDGSGLAQDNRASAGALVALLGYLSRSPDWPVFWETLPEAGTRQMRRMQRTVAARNLRAKTGTIRGVSALSGVVRTLHGERIAFSIVGNDLPSSWGAKRLEDEIGVGLASLTRERPSAGGAGDPSAGLSRAREQDAPGR